MKRSSSGLPMLVDVKKRHARRRSCACVAVRQWSGRHKRSERRRYLHVASRARAWRVSARAAAAAALAAPNTNISNMPYHKIIPFQPLHRAFPPPTPVANQWQHMISIGKIDIIYVEKYHSHSIFFQIRCCLGCGFCTVNNEIWTFKLTEYRSKH